MFVFVRRLVAITAAIRSRSPPHGPQSYPLLPRFPYTTLTTTTTAAHKTLKLHGFTDAEISKLSRKAPWVLSIRSANAMSSKMSYFSDELGLQQPQLVKIVTSEPHIFHCSLENSIIPSIAYLDSVLGARTLVIRAIINAPGILRGPLKNMAANVELLKSSGVSDSGIARILLTQRWTIIRSPDRFRELLDSVRSEEFDPSSSMFVYALQVKSGLRDSTWKKKVAAYVSSGWSDEEARLAFRRLPFTYTYSEKRIRKVLDFLMNVLRMRPGELLTYIKLISSGLEKTLLPRCSVLNVLMGRELVDKDLNVAAALTRTAESFRRIYVEQYQGDVPQVLEAYEGKIAFSGFDHLRIPRL